MTSFGGLQSPWARVWVRRDTEAAPADMGWVRVGVLTWSGGATRPALLELEAIAEGSFRASLGPVKGCFRAVVGPFQGRFQTSSWSGSSMSSGRLEARSTPASRGELTCHLHHVKE